MNQQQAMQKQINTIRETANARNRKIASKIAGLNAEADGLKKLIEQQTAEVVNYEMAGDDKAAETLRSEIRTSRTRAEEIAGEIAEYKSLLKDGAASLATEFGKLQDAVQKAEVERLELISSKREESQQLEKQLYDLKQKIQAIDHELIHSSDHQTINLLRTVMHLLDARFSGLNYSEQERYIRQWYRGGVSESFFEKDREWRGVTATQGENHDGFPPNMVVQSMNTPNLSSLNEAVSEPSRVNVPNAKDIVI